MPWQQTVNWSRNGHAFYGSPPPVHLPQSLRASFSMARCRASTGSFGRRGARSFCPNRCGWFSRGRWILDHHKVERLVGQVSAISSQQASWYASQDLSSFLSDCPGVSIRARARLYNYRALLHCVYMYLRAARSFARYSSVSPRASWYRSTHS